MAFDAGTGKGKALLVKSLAANDVAAAKETRDELRTWLLVDLLRRA